MVVSADMAYAQEQPKTYSAADIKKMADDKKIKFNAKKAVLATNGSPTTSAVGSGLTDDNIKILNNPYTIVLTPDSVASYIPYYDKTKTDGVGTNPNSMIEEDPQKSSAAISDYAVKQNKKQHTIITVKPKDGSKITKYVFDLSPDGTGKVEVTIEDYKIINYQGSFSSL